jgi:hypothetical protein
MADMLSSSAMARKRDRLSSKLRSVALTVEGSPPISESSAPTAARQATANKASAKCRIEARVFLSMLATLLVATVVVSVAAADTLPMYFGSGCFWHQQHNFVVLEESLLGRFQENVTSVTGYAGGVRVGVNGTVCYHNPANQSDYAMLGFAEAVSLLLPPASFAQFAHAFLASLEAPPLRGGELPIDAQYRTLVGFPGGMFSRRVLAPSFVALRDAGHDGVPVCQARRLRWPRSSRALQHHSIGQW